MFSCDTFENASLMLEVCRGTYEQCATTLPTLPCWFSEAYGYEIRRLPLRSGMRSRLLSLHSRVTHISISG
jgi:hypothetical protein